MLRQVRMLPMPCSTIIEDDSARRRNQLLSFAIYSASRRSACGNLFEYRQAFPLAGWRCALTC